MRHTTKTRSCRISSSMTSSRVRSRSARTGGGRLLPCVPQLVFLALHFPQHSPSTMATDVRGSRRTCCKPSVITSVPTHTSVLISLVVNGHTPTGQVRAAPHLQLPTMPKCNLKIELEGSK